MSKIEIFIGVKNLLRLLGLLHLEHPFKNAISLIQMTFFFCYLAFTVFYLSSTVYIYFEIETFAKRSELFSYFICTFILSIEMCILMRQRKLILEIITALELMIQKRMTFNSFQFYNIYSDLTLAFISISR